MQHHGIDRPGIKHFSVIVTFFHVGALEWLVNTVIHYTRL